MITAADILRSIDAGLSAGEDTWDAPGFERARQLTAEAGCVWDFTGWRDAADCIRQHGRLGGTWLPQYITIDPDEQYIARAEDLATMTGYGDDPDSAIRAARHARDRNVRWLGPDGYIYTDRDAYEQSQPR